MKKQPIVSMPELAKKLGITLHTVIRAIKQLVDKDYIKEITGRKSNKLYSYKKYIHLLDN